MDKESPTSKFKGSHQTKVIQKKKQFPLQQSNNIINSFSGLIPNPKSFKTEGSSNEIMTSMKHALNLKRAGEKGKLEDYLKKIETFRKRHKDKDNDYELVLLNTFIAPNDKDKRNQNILNAVNLLEDIFSFHFARDLINALLKLKRISFLREKIKRQKIANGVESLEFFLNLYAMRTFMEAINLKFVPAVASKNEQLNFSIDHHELTKKHDDPVTNLRKRMRKMTSQRSIGTLRETEHKLTLLDSSHGALTLGGIDDEGGSLYGSPIRPRRCSQVVQQHKKGESILGNNIIFIDEAADDDEESHGESKKEGENNRFKNNENMMQETDDIEEDYHIAGRLVMYDKFYKEHFFKKEIFKPVKKHRDIEEEEIKNEIEKTELKKKINEKRKLFDALNKNGQPTGDVLRELNDLKNQYAEKKKKPKETFEMYINNTEPYVKKGKQLYNYFNEKNHGGMPLFLIENERYIKGKEIIDFKPLDKEEKIRRFYDKWYFMETRKKIYKALILARYYCNYFVTNPIFENISISVTIINAIIILISNPRDPESIAEKSDHPFLYYFTIEMVFKVLASGFILGDNAYMKDYWNILDFLVILFGWTNFFVEGRSGGEITGLDGLRCFRILRPLKIIKYIRGLKKLMLTLISSITKLSDTTLVLMAFFLLFAICGVSMWKGRLLHRCMNVNFGYLVSLQSWEGMCTTNDDCTSYNTEGNYHICVKGFMNPDNGVVNFDDTLHAFMTVFIIATLEGWTDVWNYVSMTFKGSSGLNEVIIFFYFHFFIFFGGFYLINLFLAVTNSEFTKVERLRKEMTSKQSFYKLLKNKYDLKEKGKQQKKKKERELKMKSQKKTINNLLMTREKIREKAFHIKKNKYDIPINYNTIKDIYMMHQDTPLELYTIDKNIKEEEKYLCNDIKRQIKEINNQIKEQSGLVKKNETISELIKKSETLTNFTRSSLETDPNNPELKKSKTIHYKIYDDCLPKAIKNTQKFIEEKMMCRETKGKFKRSETIDVIKQKIEKKEIEKFNMLQISLKEDLSYEREEKEEEANTHKNKFKFFQAEMQRHLKNSILNDSRLSVAASETFSHDIGSKAPVMAKKLYKLEDELSFITDISYEHEGEFSEDGTPQHHLHNPHHEVKQKNSIISFDEIEPDKVLPPLDRSFNCNNLIDESLALSNISHHEENFANKKVCLDEVDDINIENSFYRPNALLPELLKLQHDKNVQQKLEKMRIHFNLKNFLGKIDKKGYPVETLGRRRSYLNFLQFEHERIGREHLFEGIPVFGEELRESDPGSPVIPTRKKKTKDEEFYEFLLNNDESISIFSDETLSDFELLPKKVPETVEVVDANMNLEELNKKMMLGKYTGFAIKAFFDRSARKQISSFNPQQLQSFYHDMNKKMNNFIVIDPKNPRGRGIGKTDMSHIQLENDSLDEEITTFVHSGLIRRAYKTRSIKGNINKYPIKDSGKLIVVEVNKKVKEYYTPQQEAITSNLRSRKFYWNYLNNIRDKNIKIKDTFKIDQWKHDILGVEFKNIPRKKLPENTEAWFVFNDPALNIKRYKYTFNTEFKFLEDECAYITHNLKNLPMSILEIMPRRMMDYGKYTTGQEVHLGSLGTSSRSGVARTTTLHQSGVGSFTSVMNATNAVSMGSMTNISKGTQSTLNVSTLHRNPSKLQEDLRYKKGFYERVYKKIDEFNYLTLSHYFLDEENLFFKLTDEKRRDAIKKHKEHQARAKQNVLEVKNEIRNIKLFDVKSNSSMYNQWSGNDVMYTLDMKEFRDRSNEYISRLEHFRVVLWKRAPFVKQMQKVRFAFYLVSLSKTFEYFILFMVLANSVTMALEGNLFLPETFDKIAKSEYAFNSIFCLEFTIKFIGLGPIVYFSDAATYLDVVIITFALLDMATPDSSRDALGNAATVTKTLAYLKLLRIFRVLRIAKILRKMKSMRMIIRSIKKSLANVTYISIILLIFLLIFQLLGMALLNGNMRYRSFLISFYTTFQILTTENWNTLFYDLYPISPLVFFYFLIWIFLGNYILFNLFISILLQAFEENDETNEEDEDDEYKLERLFGLPDFFYRLKEQEQENKRRLKGKKKSKRIKNPTQHMMHKSLANQKTSIVQQSLINHEATFGTSNHSAHSFVSRAGAEGSSVLFTEKGQEDSSTSSNDSKVLTLVDRFLKDWKMINVLFKENECEYSFYLLSQTNKFRIGCMQIIKSKKFEILILITIGLSTIRLVIDTFISGFFSVLIFDICDLIFNLIFLFETVIKIIALGFVLDEGSYLRDNWNKIDLIIVIVSLIDMQNLVEKYFTKVGTITSTSFDFLKILRLLRTLRPLRFISHNYQLKLIMTSLFDSILPISAALFIYVIVLFMFSIVGISLFFHLYHNCYVEGPEAFKVADTNFAKQLVTHKIRLGMAYIEDYCTRTYNGIMDTGPKFKFLNIFIGIVTSYVLGSMEGWPDIMNDYRVYGDFYGMFFVIYLLVVSYFFLNLFVGIMFKYFNEAYSKERKLADSDKKAMKYFDILKQIRNAEPKYALYLMPEEDHWQYPLVLMVKSKTFEYITLSVIFANILTMALNYDMDQFTYQLILNTLNFVFTLYFIFECVLKILAVGFKNYFLEGWNRFDFFCVTISIIDIFFTELHDGGNTFIQAIQVVRVVRVLRITKSFRMIQSMKGLEKLVQTLKWSLSSLTNVFILMMLIFCIFAILGCYLYDVVKLDTYGEQFNYLNHYYNFDNFYYSFLLTFRCITGEDWPSIMLELAFLDKKVVNEAEAYIYMIIMNFVCAVIMLNLFLMVTLQQYDEFTTKAYNPVVLFDGFLHDFNTAWNKFSSAKDNGIRMKRNLVPNFFLEFHWRKLHFPEKNKLDFVKKYVSNLKLRCDTQNYVYFYDVVFKVIVAQMGEKIDRTNPANVLILREEKRLASRIKHKINQYIMKHEINKVNQKNPLITFNPLTSHLYFKMSYTYFKELIKYYKENVESSHRRDEQVFGGAGKSSRNEMSEESYSRGDSNAFLIQNTESQWMNARDEPLNSSARELN